VKGAAEVWAAEVGAAELVGRGVGGEEGVDAGVQEDGFQAAFGEAALEPGEVEGRMDGVAGEGVVELKAEVRVGRLRGRNGAEGEARGDGKGRERAGWRGIGHWCPV
jgi:hypothetical protein